MRAADSPLFERDVAPLLAARCGKCHGEKEAEAGLDIRRRADLLVGGDSGAALVPGKPDESLLWKRITSGEMPPEKETPLSDAEKETLRQWIAGGAQLARPEEPTEAAPAPRVSDDDRDYWAFRPPVARPAPQVKHQARVRTPVDAFLLQKLEAKGLAFNPDATKAVLLRRLCFDLHGLPPTPEQLDEFLADERPDAYERLVDRLLASPRYGERWARHWLDVAGYADSDGYLAADRERPEAWRYRDYVIRAMNDDTPYDRFIKQQLAGDELSDWRRAEELTPQIIEDLTATGFLRTASDPTYPGYIEKNEVHQVISDTVQIVSSSLLGLTIQCARCHAHKYDPISQRDYYALQAILTPSYDPDRWQPSGVRGIPLATEAQLARAETHNKRVAGRVTELQQELAELTARYRKKLVRETIQSVAKTGDQSSTVADEKTLVDSLEAALLVEAKLRTAEQQQLVMQYGQGVSLAEDQLVKRFADFAAEQKKLKVAIQSEESLRQDIPAIRGLTDLDDKPAETHLLVRGDFKKPGVVVAPEVPAVLAKADFKFSPQPGYKTSGRRRALAEWIASPENPLTARAQVNRLWQHHFGRGIVPTIANLGRAGGAPSHPELLDWLAIEFIRQGWSQKAVHRLIVTSTAYRQSSDVDAVKAAADPDNVLLSAWRPWRVEGEVVRDALLSVAGKLTLDMFGPPAPVAAQPDGSVITADNAQGNRRSVYLVVRRSQHLTMLDLFDTPMMEVNCPQRTESIVPLQALALMNGPFAERTAQAVGQRVLAAAGDDVDRQCDVAFRLLFARVPTATERVAITRMLATCAAEALAEAKPEQPEAQRKQLAAERAWSQAALVLLNSNEFLHVD
ncbi:MAG TPA: PSD1 and planctomycete cytochrome C domain-containing protein [Pirellulales bacterium]|jgi:hypothetical protein